MCFDGTKRLCHIRGKLRLNGCPKVSDVHDNEYGDFRLRYIWCTYKILQYNIQHHMHITGTTLNLNS